MTPQENFRLNAPYPLTDEDRALIARCSSEPLSKEDWDKSSLNPFKQRVRNFLGPRQQRLCAFCRTPMQGGNYPYEIEHIVPKSLHTKWLFDPQNFCLACRRCNGHKLTKETLVDPNSTEYPQDGTGFNIIHPYHDTYSEHIDLVEGLFYSGLTPKGINTITICNLSRYELVRDRMELQFGHDNMDSYAIALTWLPRFSMYVNDINALLADIQRDIDNFIFNNTIAPEEQA